MSSITISLGDDATMNLLDIIREFLKTQATPAKPPIVYWRGQPKPYPQKQRDRTRHKTRRRHGQPAWKPLRMHKRKVVAE